MVVVKGEALAKMAEKIRKLFESERIEKVSSRKSV